MKGAVVCVVAAFCLAGVSWGATVCSRPQIPEFDGCSSVTLLLGASSPVHQSALRQLCQMGRQHVLNRQRALPNTEKKGHQFAVLNLHRDSFVETVNWTTGGAEDVLCSASWKVDDEVQLSNGYRWYRHGLPMWPLLNQTIGPKRRPILGKKKLDWPNFAFATPAYLVYHERQNFRDPLIGIQKLFLGDVDSKVIDPTPLDTFVKKDKFQLEATQLVTELGNDMNANPEDYRNWLLPLAKRSLASMVESFVARQKSRGSKLSKISMCPDVLYLFFMEPPCNADSSTCIVLNEIQLELRKASCSTTNLVVGHSAPVTETFIRANAVPPVRSSVPRGLGNAPANREGNQPTGGSLNSS